MKPELTGEALVRLVHRYYPAGIDNNDARYKQSEEGQRLQALIETHVGRMPAWTAFVQRLREEFAGCSI
jgi:hypothetical protein